MLVLPLEAHLSVLSRNFTESFSLCVQQAVGFGGGGGEARLQTLLWPPNFIHSN